MSSRSHAGVLSQEDDASRRMLSIINGEAARSLLEQRSFRTCSTLRVGWYNLHLRQERCVVGRIFLGQSFPRDAGRCYAMEEWQAFAHHVATPGKSGLYSKLKEI